MEISKKVPFSKKVIVFHVKRKKRQNVEKGKKRTRERRLKEGEAWSSEAAGLTQVRGVYHQLTGIMG